MTVVPRRPKAILVEPKPRTVVIAAVHCATASMSLWPAAVRSLPAGGAAGRVVSAIALLGTPCRYGGDRPSAGSDCSGRFRFEEVSQPHWRSRFDGARRLVVLLAVPGGLPAGSEVAPLRLDVDTSAVAVGP